MLEEIKNMILLYDKVEDNILVKNNITNANTYFEIKFVLFCVTKNLCICLLFLILSHTSFKTALNGNCKTIFFCKSFKFFATPLAKLSKSNPLLSSYCITR